MTQNEMKYHFEGGGENLRGVNTPDAPCKQDLPILNLKRLRTLVLIPTVSWVASWQFHNLELQPPTPTAAPSQKYNQTDLLAVQFLSKLKSVSFIFIIWTMKLKWTIPFFVFYDNIPYSLKNKIVLYYIWNKNISSYSQGCQVFMKLIFHSFQISRLILEVVL